MAKKPRFKFKSIRIDLLRPYREIKLLERQRILEQNKNRLSLFIEGNPPFLKRFSPTEFTREKFIETLLSPLTPETRFGKARIAYKVWDLWRTKESFVSGHQPLYEALSNYLVNVRYGKKYSPILWVDNAIVAAEKFLKKEVGIKY
jgi:hypothetical protein